MPENRPNRTANGKFAKGHSGNPGGRPRGAKTIAYNVREVVGEAINDPGVRKQVIEQVKGNLQNRKTVLPALEFAARLNREIGLGSGEAPAGVTIIFESNIRPRAPRPPRREETR